MCAHGAALFVYHWIDCAVFVVLARDFLEFRLGKPAHVKLGTQEPAKFYSESKTAPAFVDM